MVSPEIRRLHQMQVVNCQSDEGSDILDNRLEQHVNMFDIIRLEQHSNQDSEGSHEDQGDDKSDVFALALVFGCLFLKGTHLYGSNENEDEIRDNIINKSPMNMQQIDEKLREFYEDELFEKMLEDEPSKRIPAAQVVSQLKSIKEKLSRKEGELLKVCAEHTEPDLAEKIKDLIRYGIDVNAKDEEGRNALHHLCRHNSSSNLIDAIRHLTESGIDVKAKDNDGSNALHYLVRHNPSSDLSNIMEFLAESGMDLIAKDNDGRSPLYYSKEGKNATKMKISYDRKAFLGEGTYGHVFVGTYGGREVAVKRVLLDKVNKREEEAMLKLDHQNIIKLVHYESDHDFGYYALELCVASLDKVFLNKDDPKKYKGPMLRNIEAFLQLASGLEHIHSKNLIHRDIKPENILISETPTSQSISVTLKLAGFGLCKPVNERGTFTMKEIVGTEKYFAPEILELFYVDKEGRGTIKSDVFALGLVFGCLFLDGQHLYGSYLGSAPLNIIEKKPINMKNIDHKLRKFYAEELLTKMLEDDPIERMSSKEVVKQLKFIMDMLVRKEEELRQLCASDSQLHLTEKIKDLVDLGIDVNAKDHEGCNALHYLCRHNSTPSLIITIQILIRSGIDLNAKSNDGSTALHYLARYNQSSDISEKMELLITLFRMDGFAKDKDGRGPYYYLAEGKNVTKMRISFDRNALLGKGGYGRVFQGTYGHRQVAVKRVQSENVNKTEELAMLKLEHPNIIQLFYIENDADFKYYALELCVASLEKLFLKKNDPQKYKGPMPRQIEAFLQLALGLEHIHSMDLIHRDIKPENILISQTAMIQPVNITLKWADFGLSNPVNERGTFTMKEIKGTKNWFAPEILELLRNDKKDNEIIKNIRKNKPTNTENIHSKIREYNKDNLLTNMLADIPNRMKSANVVIELNSIKNKLAEKEEDVRQQFASDFSLALTENVKDLMPLEIDLNAKDNNGRNTLHHLCQSNSSSRLIDAIKFLKEFEIDVKVKDNLGCNTIHLLCGYNSTPQLFEGIKLLIGSGIDAEAKCNNGSNALHYLCSNNSNTNIIDAIQLLIQKGINVNSKDNNGRNALHKLCEFNSTSNLIDAIQSLLLMGIDLNAQDNNGLCAINCLRKKNSKENIPTLAKAIEIMEDATRADQCRNEEKHPEEQ